MNVYDVRVTTQAQEQIRDIAYYIAVTLHAPDAAQAMVDDLDEVIANLKAKGYEPLGEIIPTTVGRQVFVLDPNGVRICLIEHSEEYRKKYM